jgi:alpha-tubulin suppressor-like RCC1 family protein
LTDGSIACANNGQPSAPYIPIVTANATQLALGYAHYCTVVAGDEIVCAGDDRGYAAGNKFGQLGNGHMAGRYTPQIVPDLAGVAQVAVGGTNPGTGGVCARMMDGTVKGWGVCADGVDSTGLATPVPATGVTDAVDVAVGGIHSCAVSSSGVVLCWGENQNNMLGTNTGVNDCDSACPPKPVVGVTNATKVSLGRLHSCALTGGGQVICWGEHALPAPQPDVSDAVDVVAVGANTDCALTRDGGVACFSSPEVDSNKGPAMPVAGLPPVVKLAGGGDRLCAATASGEVYCWDYWETPWKSNQAIISTGLVYYDNGRRSTAPTSLADRLSDVAEIAVGYSQICARTGAGAASCFGAILGDGSSTAGTRLRPVPLPGVRQLSAGFNQVCALRDDATVWCWGGDPPDQSGDPNADWVEGDIYNLSRVTLPR